MTYKLTNATINLGVYRTTELEYVPITKNASKIIVGIFNYLGRSRRVKYVPYKSKRLFCVWRNPYDRFISGIVEYKDRNNVITTLEELIFEFDKDPTHFDEHLEPQFYFIEHVMEYEKFDYVICIETLKEDMLNYKLFDEAIIDKLPFISNYTTEVEKVYNSHQNDIKQIVEKYYQKDLEVYYNLDLIKKSS